MKPVDNISFVQLRAFAVVAKSGSFARAADELEISQPAVSEQVKLLEAKLNFELFTRRRGTTPTLTEAGQQVLDEVERIFTSLDKIKESGAAPTGTARLTISVSPKVREIYLTRILPEFYRLHPNIEIQVPAKRSLREELVALEAGELDLAVFTLPGEIVPAGARILSDIPIAFVATPATLSSLEAADFDYSRFEFVLNVRNEAAQRWTRDYLAGIGYTSKLAPSFIEFPEVAAQMVEERGCVGLFAKQLIPEKLASGAFQVLDIAIEPWRRCILRSPRAAALAEVFEAYIAENT